LNPRIPVIVIDKINRNPRKFTCGNLPYALKTINTKKREAEKKRKKIDVNRGRCKANILPATGVLPKKIVAKISLI